MTKKDPAEGKKTIRFYTDHRLAVAYRYFEDQQYEQAADVFYAYIQQLKSDGGVEKPPPRIVIDYAFCLHINRHDKEAVQILRKLPKYIRKRPEVKALLQRALHNDLPRKFKERKEAFVVLLLGIIGIAFYMFSKSQTAIVECSKGFGILDPEGLMMIVACEAPQPQTIPCKRETVQQAVNVIWCETPEDEIYRINGPVNIYNSTGERIFLLNREK